MKNYLNKILISFFIVISTGFSQDNYALDISPDGYVDIGNLSNYINNGQQFSVSFWSKVNSEQEMRISDRAGCDGGNCHRGFEFLIGAWGVSFRLIDTWSNNMLIVRETSSFGDNNWHHVAATYNGSSDPSGVNIYIDGEPYGVSTHYNSLSGTSMNDLPLRIGGNGEDSGGAGIVDEVSLWLKVLTQEEIKQAMDNGLSGDEEELLSYWNFNEGQGDVVYDMNTNSGYNGSIVNCSWTTDVPPLLVPPVPGGNNSLSFDGIDDYVDLGDLPSGLNSFSYTGWYKRSDPHNEGQPIINTPNGMVTISGGGQKIYASAYQSRNGTAPIFELETTNFGLQDEWNHFSFVVDSDIHSLFINGELVDSEADEYDFQSVYGLSQIGSHGRSNGPNDSFFNGSLDEISVWGRALTQEEIQIYYGNSPNGSEDGLIAHYDFNGGEGNTLTDLSGNGNNGTINGATWSGDVPAPPVFGCTDSYADNFNSEATSDDGSCYYPDNGEYVLSFNGSGDHVNFGTDPSTELSGDITLAAWIKFDNFNNNNAAVISKVSDGSPIAYGIEKKNSQNKISFWIGDGNSFNEVYSPNLSPDTWYFITGTNDGSTSKLYIDGQFITSAPSGYPAGPTGDLKIGVHSLLSTGGRYWDGSIDNVSIWDIVLTDEEIDNLSQSSPIGDEEGLVAYWSFNSGDGEILYDFSGNQNHGSIIGATWEEVVSGCTDLYAENYDENATIDDGSCTYPDNGDYALNFDGMDDYVQLNFSSPSQFSVETEIYINQFPSSDVSHIISQYDQGIRVFTLEFDNNGYLYFNVWVNNNWVTITDSEILNLNTLIKISAKVDNDGMSLYKNNELVSNNPTITSISENDNILCKLGSPTFGLFAKIHNLKVDGISNQSFNVDYPITTGFGNILYDHSGNQNHGTINGAAWQEIIEGCTDTYAENYDENATLDDGSCSGYPENGEYSLSFDGNGTHVNLGSDENIDLDGKSFSVDFWFKADDTNDEQIIFTKWNEHNVGESVGFLTRNNSTVGFAFVYDDLDVSVNIIPGDWYYVCGTFDADTRERKLYINGELLGSDIASTVLTNSDNGDWLVGKRGYPSQPLNFAGNVDNIGIFNSVLSQQEITQRHSGFFNDEYDKLISYWTFNSGDGNILYDHSGSLNHGDINGASWDSDVPEFPIPPVPGGNNSLSFDGIDDYVDFENRPITGSVEAFTILTSFKTKRLSGDDVSDNQYIYYQGGDYKDISLSLNNSYHDSENPNSDYTLGLHIAVSQGGQGHAFVPVETLSENTWHKAAVVWDGAYVHMYVDGVLVTTINYNIGGNFDWDAATIGPKIGMGSSDGQFYGNIDEMSFWTRALTSEEVLYYFAESPSGDENNLSTYFDFNGVEGNTLTDLSGNGNNGTINGATWSGDVPAPPVFGCTDSYADNYDSEATSDDGSCYYPDNGEYSLFFNSDNVSIGEIGDYSSKVTVMGWVKTTDGGSYHAIVSGPCGNIMLTMHENRLLFGSQCSTPIQHDTYGITELNDGEWHHVAATYDENGGDNNLRVYVDGVLEGQSTKTGQFLTGDFTIASSPAPGEYFDGSIDMLRIWNSALTQEQIQENMNSSVASVETNLLADWRFNAGEGDILYDHSGNGNHGSINGATWSDDIPYTGPEWFVSKQGNDSNNGSQDQPFESIQAAINSAGNGHIVLVAPGTYFENINYNGKNIIVSAEVGPEETVINGGQNGTVVIFNSGESNEAMLDGFTITNGGGPSSIGGGIAIVNSSPMISNVIVEHNSDMQGYGGGIDLNGETETIISNSIVRNNTALWGGGIYCHSSNPTIDYVVVSGNHSTTNAGGIYARDNSFPTITNCTIVNNSTDGLGGGILTWYNSVPEVKNSIIRGNSPTQIDHVTGGAVSLSYSNVEGYHEGDNNIDESPLFCNVSNDDYSLSQDSPCIGTGESGTDIGALGIECEESFNNYGLSFNGQSDNITVNYNESLAYNNDITISGWVKIPNNHDSWWGSVIGGWNGYGYLLYAGSNSINGSLLFYIRDGGVVTGTTDLRDNNWHHIAVTYNGNTAKVFVDGQLEAENNFETSFQGSSGYPLVLGHVNHNVGSNEHFPGVLDEIAIYDIALDQEEIQSHLNSELVGDEEGLVGYWNFNSGDGSLLVDVLGDGNDGQINGASWTMGAPLDPAQIISGCDDPYAENFNPEVNTNDGSCEYSQEPLTFTKENYADPNLAENQDRITADIWITRGDTMSLYNAAQEEYYQADSISPEGTVWASGLTALHLSIDEYKSFKQATGGGHQNLPGRTLSMHILGTDLFYDIEFHDWSSGGNGGGFSYTRTPAELNTYDYPEDTVYFEKADYADWQLEENQDRIAVNTWLTRGDQGGLFNAYSEEGYDTGSPENTEWFFGHTDSVYNEQYISWEELVDTSSGIIGQFISLHILSENKYFDVVFHDWTGGDNGGGFSYTRMQIDVDTGPLVNGSVSGTVIFASDSTAIEGALVVAVAEDSSYSGQVYTGSDGTYNMDLAGSLNYYVNISYDGLIDYNEYVFVAPFENTTVDASMDILVNGHVEGTITDWYTNAPLSGASVLFTYSDDEGGMETIESQADQDGYFMVQVPGEVDYDLFLYAEGYWVEHDAFFLSSGEHQVLSIGIAPITSASRLYGMVKDFETGEVIPYAQVQLNCEDASDWDHTGTLGTYRVFSYYPGDCADGVLVVSAEGYQSSVQSVASIDFVAGSSYDLEVELVAGGDPDPGMLSGTIFSNIDGNPIADAEIKAYSTLTTQLFSVLSSGDGSYELFLPESEYYISVSADNHQELFDTLSIVSGQALNYDFNLDEVYLNRVYGVIANQNGEAIFDSRVVATVGEDRNIVAGTWSNENGEYELFMPNGVYDIGSGINDYLMKFEDGVELSGVDVNVSLTLESVQQFEGGIAGLVNINEDDNSTVWVNVFTNDYTYNAYVPSDENGAYSLPLINGTYNLFAWVPGSNYESIYIPNAFTVENNVISYDIYFIEPAGPESPTIVFLEDVLNDQGGQMNLAWTPGDPREFEIFPQYSVWRQDEEWTLLATVPYHGFDIYNMVVPTLGDSTDTGIVQSTFMVTAHTIDPNIFFDSEPMTGYSIDNIYPGIPDNLSAVFSGEVVQLDWSTPSDDDISYYNIYRQDIGSSEPAIVFSSEENTYTDEVGYLGDFEYWVTAVDLSGNESDPSDVVAIALSIASDYLPDEFALQQNYPNPFNPSTQIRYSLPVSSNVKVVVYNMLGSKVRTLYNGNQDAGYRSVMWNATNDNGDPVAAGMYIYTIEADGYFVSKKMILLK